MRSLLLAVAVVVAGCAPSSHDSASRSEPTRARPSTFDSREFRQPAVFVRVEVRAGQLSTREAESVPGDYQGLLLEGLNAKAIVPRDLTVLTERETLDNARALARAREVGADHALLVDVAVSRTQVPFCRGKRDAFVASTLAVRQEIVVLRASDGAVRWKPEGLEATSIEPDCDSPRESRRRSTTETLQTAVDRLLARLLGG